LGGAVDQGSCLDFLVGGGIAVLLIGLLLFAA
jgi:hypothetical protein